MTTSIDLQEPNLMDRTTIADAAGLQTQELTALGLSENDLPEVKALALQIQSDKPETVFAFGRQISNHTAQYADALLDQVRNGDLDEAGAKLTEVLVVAQKININPLLNTRSKLPVIGRLIDMMRLKQRKLMGQFDSTKVQIEKLIQEVSLTRDGMEERNKGLTEMFHAVKEEYRLLGIHIAAGKQRLVEIRTEANQLRSSISNDPLKLQQVSDMDNLAEKLDKRIGDLYALQQSALQTLPTIRVIQHNNEMLVEKLHSVETVTVPAWHRQFMISLALNEQRNSVELANNIDNTTNELLRKNAQLLYQNSVESAKANQRLVIDIETLKSCQNMLLTTVAEVIVIRNEGVASRKRAEREIQDMRMDLQKRLSGATDAPQKVLH